MATEALAISDIDTYYGDSHVLHGVSFALHPGRLLGLLGRNGAGKTTCMSTIMGFLKPRRGAIALFGEPVTSLPADIIARKGICLVPQGRRMFRTLTVRENLMVAAQRRARRRPRLADRPRVCSSFRASRSATRRLRARSPAASSRCWRSAARSWAIRACC